MFNSQTTSGRFNDHAHKCFYRNRRTSSAIIEREGSLLALHGGDNKFDQIIDIEEIARFFPGTPHCDAIVAGRQHLGDCRAENMTALKIEFIVRAIDV